MDTVPTTPAPLPQPRLVPAGRGTDWVAEAFGLFKQAPGVWIGILLIWMVISVLISAVGLGIVGPFVNVIFNAGIMLGCASLARGEGLRVEHLFAGFKSGRVGQLLMVTLWTFVLALVAGVALVLLIGLPLFGTLAGLENASAEDALRAIGLTGLLLVALAVLAIALLIAMATWFAPPLVLFHNVSALDAMVLSFRGCLRNWLPLLVYGLVVLVMIIVAVIPLLLGLLIAIPVLVASVYTSYRDLWPEQAPGQN